MTTSLGRMEVGHFAERMPIASEAETLSMANLGKGNTGSFQRSDRPRTPIPMIMVTVHH